MGPLTTALAAHRPTLITDSFLAREATRANLARNGVEVDTARLLTTGTFRRTASTCSSYGCRRALPCWRTSCTGWHPPCTRGRSSSARGVKEIHTSTLKLFERVLGPTRTSLAEQKSRLVFCTPDPALVRAASPWPYRYELPHDTGALSGRTVTNHAGVFCADHLDIGTRFFLGHLPQGGGARRIVDLGCGNGVVGLAAALAEPEAEVVFVDESYQAVASAEATYRDNAGGKAEFLVGDGMSGLPDASVDLVLSNPPFHSHQATRTPSPGGCSRARGVPCGPVASCGWSATVTWVTT